MKMHKWTDEEIEYLREIVPNRHRKDICNMFREHFNCDLTDSVIVGVMKRKHISSGLDGHFQKGHVSPTKGKTWDEYMPKEAQERCRKTQFKRGIVPHNRNPIGSIYWDERDKYLRIKTSDGHLQNNYVALHRKVFEHFYGEIPDGYNVRFADGNCFNIAPDNLLLVSNKEQIAVTNILKNEKDPDVAETRILVMRLNKQILAKEKDKQG